MEYNCNYVVVDLETGGFSADKNPAVEVAIYVINSNLFMSTNVKLNDKHH